MTEVMQMQSKLMDDLPWALEICRQRDLIMALNEEIHLDKLFGERKQ